jgi:hypothetical protein
MAGSADAMRSQDAFDRIEKQFNAALDSPQAAIRSVSCYE